MSNNQDQEKTSLWTRCRNAGGWAFVSSGGTQFIRMLRVLLLTYFIAPDQLGLWVLLIAVIGAFNEFTDTGVKHALIQNPRGNQSEYLSCAWLISAGRSLLLIFLLFLLAPLIAEYYQPNFNATELTSIFRLGCLLFLFDGLSSISLVIMRKNLTFKSFAIIQIISNLIGLSASIYFSWRWHNAQGILVGEILTSVVLCILSYIIHPFRPCFRWNKKVAWELFAYGGMTYLVAMVDTIAMRLDILIISNLSIFSSASNALSGQELVGLYGLGVVVIMAPTLLLNQLAMTVGFPALSTLQNDFSALRRALLEITKATQFIAIPLFAILFILAPDIVTVLPEKYVATGVVIRGLSVTGFCVVFLRQLTPALYAINKVHWCVTRGIIHIVVFMLLIFPLSRRWGLTGICWATNLAYLASVLMIFWVTLRELRWSLYEWISAMSLFIRPVLGGTIAFFVTNSLLSLAGLRWEESLAMRLGSCCGGLLFYGLLSLRCYLIPLKKNLYPQSTCSPSQ